LADSQNGDIIVLSTTILFIHQSIWFRYIAQQNQKRPEKLQVLLGKKCLPGFVFFNLAGYKLGWHYHGSHERKILWKMSQQGEKSRAEGWRESNLTDIAWVFHLDMSEYTF
jgi:hypothetical protein